MPITKEQYEFLIDTAKKDVDGVAWWEMGRLNDGRKLCLVMGYSKSYEEGEKYQIKVGKDIYTLCQKLAVNIDDLQCDYEVDWFMPWYKTDGGEVWDTDMAVKSSDDIDYYNEEAEEMIKKINEGFCEVY